MARTGDNLDIALHEYIVLKQFEKNRDKPMYGQEIWAESEQLLNRNGVYTVLSRLQVKKCLKKVGYKTVYNGVSIQNYMITKKGKTQRRLIDKVI